MVSRKQTLDGIPENEYRHRERGSLAWLEEISFSGRGSSNGKSRGVLQVSVLDFDDTDCEWLPISVLYFGVYVT